MKVWIVTNPWLDHMPFLAATSSQVIDILERIWPGEPFEIEQLEI